MNSISRTPREDLVKKRMEYVAQVIECRVLIAAGIIVLLSFTVVTIILGTVLIAFNQNCCAAEPLSSVLRDGAGGIFILTSPASIAFVGACLAQSSRRRLRALMVVPPTRRENAGLPAEILLRPSVHQAAVRDMLLRAAQVGTFSESDELLRAAQNNALPVAAEILPPDGGGLK